MKRMFVSEEAIWKSNKEIELSFFDSGEAKYIPGMGYLVKYPGTRCEITESNKSETDVNYIVSFPDHLGLTGGGDTIEEALVIAAEALEMWLEVKRSDKTEILLERGKNE